MKQSIHRTALSLSPQLADSEFPKFSPHSPDLHSYGDAELIAAIIGRQPLSLKAQTLALAALKEVGGLVPLARRSPLSLLHLHGLSPQQAERLWAAFEVGRRAMSESLQPCHDAPLDREAAASWARVKLGHLEHEEVWVICVGAQMRFMSAHQVGKGGLHACALLTRDVLIPVLRSGCQGFILIHNHPSGSPEPSSEDLELTSALEAAATSVCVPLIDHLIVAREGSTSFQERGLL